MPNFRASAKVHETQEAVSVEYHSDSNALIIGDKWATHITRGTRVYLEKLTRSSSIVWIWSGKPHGKFERYEHLNNIKLDMSNKDAQILLKSMDLGKSEAGFYFLGWNEKVGQPLKMKPFDLSE